MNIQQINPKILSITQVRRDIDVLYKTLVQENEALVMKNQQLLFIAVNPKKYEEFFGDKNKKSKIVQAIAFIKKIRENHKVKTKSVSKYIIKMRDERIKKWKNSFGYFSNCKMVYQRRKVT